MLYMYVRRMYVYTVEPPDWIDVLQLPVYVCTHVYDMVHMLYFIYILYLQLRSCGYHSVLIPHARIVFRLYWFITKALYSSAHVSRLTCINIAFYLPFNVMLFALYLMQVYWFIFIVKLLIKVRTLGIDDITQIKVNCIITYIWCGNLAYTVPSQVLLLW